MMATCSWRPVSCYDEEGVEGWECETHSTPNYAYFVIQEWDTAPSEPCSGAPKQDVN